MNLSPFIEPERCRRLRSPRLWLAAAAAAVITVSAGELSLLWRCAHPWALPAAFLLGHVLFGFSRGLGRLSLRAGRDGFVASVRFLYRPYGGETLLFYFFLALAEELIFRAVPLSLLEGSWEHVLGLSLLFAAIHVFPWSRRGGLLRVLDLFSFAVIVGFLFVWLGDLWPLVIVHWVRNGSVAKTLVRRERLEALLRTHEETPKA